MRQRDWRHCGGRGGRDTLRRIDLDIAPGCSRQLWSRRLPIDAVPGTARAVASTDGSIVGVEVAAIVGKPLLLSSYGTTVKPDSGRDSGHVRGGGFLVLILVAPAVCAGRRIALCPRGLRRQSQVVARHKYPRGRAPRRTLLSSCLAPSEGEHRNPSTGTYKFQDKCSPIQSGAHQCFYAADVKGTMSRTRHAGE